MKIIEEREKFYGDFKEIARISQKIKNIYHVENVQELDPVVNEGFEMIAHKLARIINGGSKFIDNWRDLAGYAMLVANYLETHPEAIDAKVIYLEKDINNEWREIRK